MRLLTAQEVSDILQIPRVSVYELCRTHRLPHVKIGRLTRIPEDKLQEWIASGGAPLHGSEEEEATREAQNPRALESMWR
jgi:excisionase family DNA binding protein